MSELKNLTESQILSKAKEGNMEAIDLIINRYRGTVEAIAARYSNPQLDYDDIFQEGMIGLLAAVKTFDGSKGSKFSTYCYSCVSNSIQAAIKKVNRKKDIPPKHVIPLEEENVGNKTSQSAEDSFLSEESVTSLMEQINNSLSDLENKVFRLRMMGCSYNDIGDKLGITPKAVDNAVQRIRKKLNSITF